MHKIYRHFLSYSVAQLHSDWAMGWQAQRKTVLLLVKAKIFLFTAVTRLALGPTQPPFQCKLGVKWLGLPTHLH